MTQPVDPIPRSRPELARLVERDPLLLKFVRRSLRRDASLTPDQLVEKWHEQAQRTGRPATDADDELIRGIFEEEAAAASERREVPQKGDVLAGCGVVLLVNVVVAVALAFMPFRYATAAAVLIGLIQLVYLLPFGVWLRSRGFTATLQGAIIAAALTFTWSAACFALIGAYLLRLQ